MQIILNPDGEPTISIEELIEFLHLAIKYKNDVQDILDVFEEAQHRINTLMEMD